MSIREVSQCTGHLPNGNRCKKRTGKVGPMCWMHTKSKLGLQVKRSTIPGAGLGLFATKKLPKGSEVDEYRGKMLNEEQIDNKANTDYVFRINQNKYIDAEKTNSCVGTLCK